MGIIATPARRAGAGLPPGSYLPDRLYLAACLAIPGIMAAAWYAIRAVHLPPGGPVGLWVALLLVALFGAQSVLALVLVGSASPRGMGRIPPRGRPGTCSGTAR